MAYDKVRAILTRFGTIDDEAKKVYGPVLVLNYGKGEQHLQEIVVKAPHFTIEDDHIMCIPSTQQRKHAHTGYDVLNSMMTSFSLFKQLALSVAVTVFTSRRLVKNYLNPKRIFYNIELMVQMLLIL